MALAKSWLLACTVALSAAGCESSANTGSSSTELVQTIADKAGASAGPATVHVVWPCHVADFVMSESLKPDYTILVDARPVAKITTCHYKIIPVPAGTHAIRIRVPSIDFEGAFTDGEKFNLAANNNLYLRVVMVYGGGAYLKEIGAQDAKEVIEAIRKF